MKRLTTIVWVAMGAVFAATPARATDSSLVSSTATVMTSEEISQLLEQQKKGSSLIIELRDHSLVYGKFLSYDGDDERLWLVVPGEGTLFHQRAILLGHIRSTRLGVAPEDPKAWDALKGPQYKLINSEIQ